MKRLANFMYTIWSIFFFIVFHLKDPFVYIYLTHSFTINLRTKNPPKPNAFVDIRLVIVYRVVKSLQSITIKWILCGPNLIIYSNLTTISCMINVDRATITPIYRISFWNRINLADNQWGVCFSYHEFLSFLFVCVFVFRLQWAKSSIVIITHGIGKAHRVKIESL